MGIRDDLAKARDDVKNILPWEKAIELMCARNQVSASEIARWLVLKEVQKYINTYILNPSIPIAGKVSSEVTVNFLQKIISPSWLDAIQKFQIINQQFNQRDVKMEAIDLIELNAFLESNGAAPITLEISVVSKNANPLDEVTETLPQKRIRIIVESLSGDEGYSDKLSLPTSAKSKLKTELLKKHPKIFTESTFNKAWADASASEIIGIADKKKFTPRK